MEKITGIILIIFLVTCCTTMTSKRDNKTVGADGSVAKNGMVVSAHRLSSEAGIRILREGGNAIDAAVATEFALSVCYPEAGNIGGGGFMVIRLKDGKTDVIDYREKAPMLASRDMYLDKSGNVLDSLSTESHLASGVPGTVDGMINAHSKYGRLPFKDVIQPAIDLAEKGFSITAGQAEDLNSNRSVFLEHNSPPIAFVKETKWKEGDTLIQKDLAETLIRIRDSGRDGFYSGKTAQLIIEEMKRGSGIISETDLSDYRSVSRSPLLTDYKGFKIITVPPPSSGGVILIQLLKMTEPFPVKEWGFHSAKTVHLIVEAEKLAFADRSEHMGDPEFMKVSSGQLINLKYLTNRMSGFDENKVVPSVEIKPGTPAANTSEETTHYSVVDSEGNAVSATTTLNGTFGSGIVVKGAGFLLNNQMDDFSIKPGFPNMYGLIGGEVNSISPGKKILSSMTPTIVEKDGKLFLVIGSPGGSTIPTSVFQVIVNVIDYNMNIQQAIDAGRFHHQWLPDTISYENDVFDKKVEGKLIEMGYSLKERSSIGRVNAVIILPDGQKSGGADKRGNNSACGY